MCPVTNIFIVIIVSFILWNYGKMEKKKYKSGSEKRKLKAQTEERDKIFLSRIPKLTNLFRNKTNDINSNSLSVNKTTENNQILNLILLQQKIF